MELAKPHVDLGLYTNNREDMLRFWQEEAALPFDHLLKLGGGVHQLRHDMNGSVLKINAARDPLPEGGKSGFHGLLIAREGVQAVSDLVDPDGNQVSLVPVGYNDVVGIGICLTVSDVFSAAAFYEGALDASSMGENRYRIGDTVLFLTEGEGASLDAPRNGIGYRYMTIQVTSVDQSHANILARGGLEGSPPVTLGETARISFVRDPDGNWIEISQRKSLTGSLAAI